MEPADLTPGHALLLLVTAARPRRSVLHGIEIARGAGADVRVGASESALGWLDRGAVESATGRPLLNAGGDLPERVETVWVTPATFNTVNELAGGIADTLVTAVAAKAIGAGRRVVVAPSVSTALLTHPVAQESRRRLLSYGVHLLWLEVGNEEPDTFDTWWEGVIDGCALRRR